MEEHVLGELYRRHSGALVRFASTLVGPHDAEDVVARAFLNVMTSRSSIEVNPRSYLYMCVNNEARRHLRTQGRRHRREALSVPPSRSDEVACMPEILDALRSLAPQQRAVIHLTYWEDLAPGQVAERLGVSDGTVRRQLARARRRLASALEAGHVHA